MWSIKKYNHISSLPPSAPSPPQGVAVAALPPTSLQVSWTSLASTGVNGYEVSYSPVSGSCEGVTGGRVVVEGGSVTRHELRGLEAYTEYNVTVRARSADGFGLPSDAQRERTMADSMLK